MLLTLDPAMRFSQRFIIDWRRAVPGQPDPELLAVERRNEASRKRQGMYSYMSRAEVEARKAYDEEMKARERDNG